MDDGIDTKTRHGLLLELPTTEGRDPELGPAAVEIWGRGMFSADEHYAGQIERLGDSDPELRDVQEQFGSGLLAFGRLLRDHGHVCSLGAIDSEILIIPSGSKPRSSQINSLHPKPPRSANLCND
jgi:hypothetical protein